MLPPVTVWEQTKLIDDHSITDESGDWKPLSIAGHGEIIGMILTVLIITIFALAYYFMVRKMSTDTVPKGYVLVIQMLVMSVRNFVVDLLGNRYEKVTPFFLLLLLYISVANVIGIIGIAPPTASLTVTFSLGLMMFFGMISIALIHQRQSYFWTFFFHAKLKKKKIPIFLNPIALVGEIAPLLSISIRLWGNMFAGIILTIMFYYCIENIFAVIPLPVLAAILSTVFGGILSTFLHFYFDVIVGTLQGVVFFMLAILYWNVRKSCVEDEKNNKISSFNVTD